MQPEHASLTDEQWHTLQALADRIIPQDPDWPSGWQAGVGDYLARQFEHLCHKPRGWMDAAHDGAAARTDADGTRDAAAQDESAPRDDDERFIVGLVLTYYRRHPQRARTRLLDLLGEVLTAAPASPQTAPTQLSAPSTLPAPSPRALPTPIGGAAELDDWRRLQQGIAPLKPKKKR